MADTDRLIEIFNEAKARPAGVERDGFLAEACGDDAELKEQALSLLYAHEAAGGFLQAGPALSPEMEAELARLKPEEVGERVGPYKLREQIGQGGFGVVWVAEQEKPVRRTVALKIIKLGMDTHEVVARFEQERQALAMMDHPNIAKVFDAGATEHGRPFFVMELVRGIKITDYCDQADLPTAERLALFITVCHAVQHAHQNGIIHRDLKPSNILVTLHDGVPVPKVIDFGVAKATQGRLAEHTVYTQFQQMIGTPLYMSPEQAEMSGLNIDTRSDIYSLGVLLYELLTGRTPFDPEELMRQGLDEIRRTIREVEPQTPSMFLKTMAQATRASVAQRRQSDPAKLSKLVRGDLDWIVMKALEKDRARRYETASGLAKDIERHLASEPVLARPTSQLYRFRRLVRRNRVVVVAASAVAAALIIGLGLAIHSFWNERRALAGETNQREIAEREAAKAREQTAAAEKHAKAEAASRLEAEAVSNLFINIFQSPEPERDGRVFTVAEALNRAVPVLESDLASQPARRARLEEILGWTYRALGLYREALPLFEKVRDYDLAALGPDHPNTLNDQHNLALAYRAVGDRDEALKLLEALLPLRVKVNGPENPGTLSTMNNLAISYADGGRQAEALKLREQVLVLRLKVNGPEHADTIRAMGNLADSYNEIGRQGEALEKRKEVLALQQKLHGSEHPETLTAMSLLALSYQQTGHREEALQLGEKVLNLALKVFGPEHPDTLSDMHNLANFFADVGRKEEALKLREKVLDLRRKVNGAKHPDTIGAIRNLVGSYFETAAVQAWLSKDADHAITCRRLLELAAGTDDATVANRAAKAYCLRPSSDPQLNEAALLLAHRAVDLDHGQRNLPWDQMVLGMTEYRQGHYLVADQALTAAEESAKGNGFVQGPARFFRAMSLVRQGKEAEARQLFAEAGSRMKPLPTGERQPFTNGAGPDDLIVWLAYKEVKALLQPLVPAPVLPHHP